MSAVRTQVYDAEQKGISTKYSRSTSYNRGKAVSRLSAIIEIKIPSRITWKL